MCLIMPNNRSFKPVQSYEQEEKLEAETSAANETS